MNKLILTICFCIFIFHAKAQNFQKLINANKIDSFAIYKSPSSSVSFLFWTKQNKYFISKEVIKQKKSAFETIVLDSLSPLSFYILNDQDIDNSIIRRSAFSERSSAIRQDTFNLSNAEDAEYEWTMSKEFGYKTTRLNVFDIRERSVQNETNLFFAHNNSLPIAILFKKTEELLHQIGWFK